LAQENTKNGFFLSASELFAIAFAKKIQVRYIYQQLW